VLAQLAATTGVRLTNEGHPPGGQIGACYVRWPVESMVELNGRLRGLLAGRADLPMASLYLRTDGPGFCLHGPMAGYDRRTARLLAEVEAVGAELPERLAGDDPVHFDFDPGNVLVDQG
jgi:hypothetical protein